MLQLSSQKMDKARSLTAVKKREASARRGQAKLGTWESGSTPAKANSRNQTLDQLKPLGDLLQDKMLTKLEVGGSSSPREHKKSNNELRGLTRPKQCRPSPASPHYDNDAQGRGNPRNPSGDGEGFYGSSLPGS